MAITLTQSKLIDQVKRRVDDTPSTADVVDWLNAGINVMAMQVNAIFPQLGLNGDSVLVFDDKWAEIPVLYACARFKQMDLMVSDADRYMQQFDSLLREFNLRYQVPAQYKDDPNTQQFTSTVGQMDFVITKEDFNPTYGDLVVYKKDIKLVKDVDYTVTETGFTLTVGAVSGDYFTAIWEIHADLVEPPFSHWTW